MLPRRSEALSVTYDGSMLLAQASSGVAAACPTPGTTLTTAEDARQRNAARPQPESERYAKTTMRARMAHLVIASFG